MVKNYIKIAWRNIVRSPFYSLVNITGLSAGIAFTLLIAAFVWSELKVNHSLKNADQQYIIQSRWKDPNLGYDLTTLGPLAKELRDRYPDLVANYYRYDGITSNVSKGDKHFREGLQVGDSTLLRMFGFSLLHGNAASAFEGPFSLVISQEIAHKYFGKTNVIGQTLNIENFSGSSHDFIVTGVLNKFSKNSITHLVEDYPNQFFISSSNLSFFGRNMDWNNSSIPGYIELQKGVKPEDLEKPIKYLVKQNANAQVVDNLTPYLVPLKRYYLRANNGVVEKMMYALSSIALFILIMAVINFVNMSVSRSSVRMKEIGIRKVLGGLRKQLIIQFLSESIILVFFAMLLGIGIYAFARGLFTQIIGKEIPVITQFPLYFTVYILLFVLATGFIAGIYPALVLSSVKSVDSLKGKILRTNEKPLLRKSLMAFQFGTATIVFVSAIIISQQIHLFFSKDLGYNKDYIVSAQLPRNWSRDGVRQMETLRNQFAGIPQVVNVTLSYEVPDGNNSGNSLIYKAGADSTSAISTQLLYTDQYYATTYNIPMVAGVFYSQPSSFSDSSTIVINETQARAFGWKDPHEAIGRQLKFPGSPGDFTIAGVTKDFHFGSMQKAIQPVTFLQVALTSTFRFFSFKLKPGDIGKSIGALQNKWLTLMPGTPFEYKFMDDTLKKLYKTEIQLKQASYTATVLSLIIVLLGVLGLISLNVQKRTKEIGIRKVLGSSVKEIIALFMKEFLRVVAVAGILACPVAYLLMNNWLSDYVYRIDITAMPFIISIVLLGFVTAVLIFVQTIKTAMASPVKSLRTE